MTQNNPVDTIPGPTLITPDIINTIGATIKVNMDTGSPIMISNFNSGMSQVDNSFCYPWGTNDKTAINNAKTLVRNSVSFVNQHTQAWGSPDIWPDPTISDPTKWDWSLLDSQMQNIIDTGATPVISLAEAPWWMKGQLQKDGTTNLIPDVNGEWYSHTYPEAFTDYRGITYPAGYVSPGPYGCRILDNQMGNWIRLCQEIAKRYMAAPYNVRYFQVWNELKGYYDPAQNRLSYENDAGDPSGYNAKSGYTYMYNQVYTSILYIAKSLGIPSNNIYVGGPYVVMDTWANSSAGGWPSREASLQTKDYGTYDQRDLDVVKYWLQNKVGAGFITIDGSNSNRDIDKTDPFTASEKFADVTKWIRSLDNKLYPGAQTLPIWWAEWGVSSKINITVDYDNAVKSYALVKQIKAGTAVALPWGSTDLWTPTNIVGGGQSLPWYSSYTMFNDYFSSGTQLYTTTISDPTSLEAISSLTKTLLINKTNNTLNVTVNKLNTSLNPWEVEVIDNK